MQGFARCRAEARTPIVVAACRTPIGAVGGVLSGLDVTALQVPLIQRLLSATGVAGHDIDDVIVGNAAGASGNIARLAALAAGLPLSVPGVTVDRQCGSGLEAIIQACRLIEVGAGECYIAGGAEAPSTAPWRFMPPVAPGQAPQRFHRARFSPDVIGDPDMGEAAENVAEACGISRARQDAFALESHRRALAAMASGRFAGEIVAVATAAGLVAADEGPRARLDARLLARLKPAFRAGGTVTAGNACAVNDGAALTLILSRARARALGLTGLTFVDAAAAGVDPNLLGLGPVASTQRLMARLGGMRLDEIGVIEINEAFAAQVLASLDRLAVDAARVNAEGGAIALGHPFGASGAVLVTRLMAQMRGRTGAMGLATIGIGGGMGLSAVFGVG